MQSALITLAVTSGIFVGLVYLYKAELRRGARYGESWRLVADRMIIRLYELCTQLTQPFRRDTMRHSIHYFFHRTLKWLKHILRTIESRVDMLLRTNKALARKVSSESSSRLQEIAVHKKESALSPEERQQKKERAIGTKL